MDPSEPVQRRASDEACAEPEKLWRADRLDVRLRQGRLDPQHLRAVAQALVRVHAAQPAPAARAGEASALALCERAHALADRLAAALGDDGALGALRERTTGAIRALGGTLEQRIAHGRLALGPADRSLRDVYVDAVGNALLAAPAGASAPCAADAALAVSRVGVGLAAPRSRRTLPVRMGRRGGRLRDLPRAPRVRGTRRARARRRGARA